MRQTESLFLAQAEESLEHAVAGGGGVAAAAADADTVGFAAAIVGVAAVAAVGAVAGAAVIDVGVDVVADFAGAGSVGAAVVDAKPS